MVTDPPPAGTSRTGDLLARMVLATIVGIAGAVFISACGSYVGTSTGLGPDAASQSRGSQLPAGTASGPLVQAQDYASNVHLDPPGNAVANLSASDAFAACNNRSTACMPSAPTRVELALMTAANYGDDHRLVWAITWSHVDCMLFGPPGQPSPRANVATGCDFVTFIDADSGAYLLATDGPPAVVSPAR
jgi:hypothetical protein